MGFLNRLGLCSYTRTYSNGMTFATVKARIFTHSLVFTLNYDRTEISWRANGRVHLQGGGHTAPEYRPEESFAMYERWISQEPL